MYRKKLTENTTKWAHKVWCWKNSYGKYSTSLKFEYILEKSCHLTKKDWLQKIRSLHEQITVKNFLQKTLYLWYLKIRKNFRRELPSLEKWLTVNIMKCAWSRLKVKTLNIFWKRVAIYAKKFDKNTTKCG